MNDNKYAYAEVLDILDNMEETYVKKIPDNLIEHMRENMSKDYVKHITPGVDLKEQNLTQETKAILALINLKYWTDDESKRKELLKMYKQNNKK